MLGAEGSTGKMLAFTRQCSATVLGGGHDGGTRHCAPGGRQPDGAGGDRHAGQARAGRGRLRGHHGRSAGHPESVRPNRGPPSGPLSYHAGCPFRLLGCRLRPTRRSRPGSVEVEAGPVTSGPRRLQSRCLTWAIQCEAGTHPAAINVERIHIRPQFGDGSFKGIGRSKALFSWRQGRQDRRSRLWLRSLGRQRPAEGRWPGRTHTSQDWIPGFPDDWTALRWP